MDRPQKLNGSLMEIGWKLDGNWMEIGWKLNGIPSASPWFSKFRDRASGSLVSHKRPRQTPARPLPAIHKLAIVVSQPASHLFGTLTVRKADPADGVLKKLNGNSMEIGWKLDGNWMET